MFSRIVIGFDDPAQAQDAQALARLLAADEAKLSVVYQGAGALASDVHEAARASAADLIVVGVSQHGATTAARVLHGAPCAVAIAPAGSPVDDARPIRRIGVGFDGGGEARHALTVAARLAADRHARLTVISAIEPIEETLGPGGSWLYPEYRADAVARISAEIDDAVAALSRPRLPVDRSVVDGPAAVALLRASEQLDLLVLGSRADGPLGRLLAGGVAARVARAARCPVLVWPRSAAIQLAAAGG